MEDALDVATMHTRIEDNCKLLQNGYNERVEYIVQVAYHSESCKYHAKTRVPKDDCECRVENETRIRNIHRPGYLQQLKEFAQNKDTDRNPKAERGAPRIKVAGRPPGDMGGFFTLDEIVVDIVRTVDIVLEEVGRDRHWAAMSVDNILIGLPNQVAQFMQARVDSARSTLKITVGDSIFDKIVCGNCGGGLATPWGNRGEADVRCVGTPSAGPCGETYPMSEWIKLYEAQR
jgi:hypothetical protein